MIDNAKLEADPECPQLVGQLVLWQRRGDSIPMVQGTLNSSADCLALAQYLQEGAEIHRKFAKLVAKYET
jgi:hypothetical protein